MKPKKSLGYPQVKGVTAPPAIAPVVTAPVVPMNAEERRAYARLAAELSVFRREAGNFVQEWTRDISMGGISVRTRSLLLPGTEGEFTLTTPDGSFEIPFVGKVMNARSINDEFPYLAGVRIIRMEPGLVATYESLILRQLSLSSGLRSTARFRFDCVAFWKPPGAAPAHTARLVDISSAGAQLAAASLLDRGSRGLLTLTSPVDGQLFTIPAEVMWTVRDAAEDRAGIRFITDGPAGAVIAELLQQVLFTPRQAVTAPVSAELSVQVGDFECRTLIAVGHHWEVFSGRARTGPLAGKRVVLKRLRPEGATPGVLGSLLEEATLGRLLNHPAAARVHTALQFGTEHWQVTELADGRSLSQVIARHVRARQPLPVPAALSVASEVELAVTHRRSVARAHGLACGPICVKPSGVVIGRDGQPRIVDFGKLDVVQAGEPGVVTAAATFPYLPPEAWPQQSAELDAADVYLIAVLIYEALTGVCPFRGVTLAEVRTAQRRGPVPMSKLNPSVPAVLEQLVGLALSADPHQRPPNPAAFLTELHRLCPFERGEEGRALRATLADPRPIALSPF